MKALASIKNFFLQTGKYDHYDDPGHLHSLTDFCIFCQLAQRPDSPLYEDPHCLVFLDRAPQARFHALCIPKRHIRDMHALKTQDAELLKHLEATA